MLKISKRDVLNVGVNAALAGTSIASKIASHGNAETALKGAGHGIFELLEHKYPGFEGFLKAIEKIMGGTFQKLKGRLKVWYIHLFYVIDQVLIIFVLIQN